MLSRQRFQSSDDAEQAIQSLDGTDYLGQRITVEVRVVDVFQQCQLHHATSEMTNTKPSPKIVNHTLCHFLSSHSIDCPC